VTGPHARLHRALVTADGATPRRFALFLHGILGSGGNFRTLAKGLVNARPEWGVALVDLRGHGLSSDAPAPNTVEAAAADLFATEAALEAELGAPVAAVAGHSFGGKVALAYLGQRAQRGAAPMEHGLILDSTPTARAASPTAEDSLTVLGMLERLPTRFVSRADFSQRVRAEGYSQSITDWLAMNVQRDGDAFTFRLDLKVIRALIEDYFTRDLWSVVESPAAAQRLHFLVGGHSTLVDTSDRQRLAAIALRSPHLALHVLEDAGHWLHVDEPEGVLTHFVAALGGEPKSSRQRPSGIDF
jgi:esterase